MFLACSTAIGIRCKDGVVFGVEKLVLSKLYEEGSNKRIFNIDRHVGMASPLYPYFVCHFSENHIFRAFDNKQMTIHCLMNMWYWYINIKQTKTNNKLSLLVIGKLEYTILGKILENMVSNRNRKQNPEFISWRTLAINACVITFGGFSVKYVRPRAGRYPIFKCKN